MSKNLESGRKIGLSFEILGVLAKLSLDENVEKKGWFKQCPGTLLSSVAATALPVNSFDFVNKNKSFPPVQRKQQQKYTES